MTEKRKPNPLDRIERNPAIMVGKPVVKGTRITVDLILEKLAANVSIEEILVDYPHLVREDVLAAVAYARTTLPSESR